MAILNGQKGVFVPFFKSKLKPNFLSIFERIFFVVSKILFFLEC
jgi:hypothetical protein